MELKSEIVKGIDVSIILSIAIPNHVLVYLLAQFHYILYLWAEQYYSLSHWFSKGLITSTINLPKLTSNCQLTHWYMDVLALVPDSHQIFVPSVLQFDSVETEYLVQQSQNQLFSASLMIFFFSCCHHWPLKSSQLVLAYCDGLLL